MASAFGWKTQEADADGENVNIALSVLFYGADVVPPRSLPVNFTVTATDTLVAMRDKAVDAVMARGAAEGFGMARTRVVVPSLARGV